MPIDYNSIVGSGTTANIAHSPAYNAPQGTWPIPSQRDSVRNRRGEGVVVLNPENFSVSIGLNQQAISVSSSAIPLPTGGMEYRRALLIYNSGPGTLYIGKADVTTANGMPISVGEKIAIDCQATIGLTVYGISDSTADVRILELA